MGIMVRKHPFASRPLAGLSLILMLGLAACAGDSPQVEHRYPTEDKFGGPTDALGKDEGPGLFGGDGITLFGGGSGGEGEGGGIGVNGFLWRATLDTLAFMPLVSADPFGGVIITDWYANSAEPSERVKVTVYILDKKLRADGVRVSVFRQELANGVWHDGPVSQATATQIENAILTRARELRVETVGKDG